MILPFVLTWSLGGPIGGSGVALWAGLGPILALMLGHRRLDRAGRLFVPASAIGNVENETVHLGIANREVEAMGWQQPPRTSDELHTGPEPDIDRDI